MLEVRRQAAQAHEGAPRVTLAARTGSRCARSLDRADGAALTTKEDFDSLVYTRFAPGVLEL